MTRDEAFGLGYLCGHAAIGTEDSRVPEINQSGALRGEYRRGFEDGRDDAMRGIRNPGAPPLTLSVPDVPVERHRGWNKEPDRRRRRSVVTAVNGSPDAAGDAP